MNVTAGTRALRQAATSLRTVAAASMAGSSRAASTYTAQPFYAPKKRFDDTEPLPRRARPPTTGHFTGKPEYTEAIASLEKILEKARAALRKEYIWPVPADLPYVQPPVAFWRAQTDMGFAIRKNSDYTALLKLLNACNSARHIASLAGSYDVAAALDEAVMPYERADRIAERAAKLAARENADSGIDALGRAYATGRRKNSSARVWVVPSKQGRELLDQPSEKVVGPDGDFAPEIPIEIPTGEVLINHLLLPQHFTRPVDRETVLRPLRVTGLVGAFNVFALARGGGSTGQAGAIALGIGRALALLRDDAVPALRSDLALMRDNRMTERKKTGRKKARAGVSTRLMSWGEDGEGVRGIAVVLWVPGRAYPFQSAAALVFTSARHADETVGSTKKLGTILTHLTVHLGQALSMLLPITFQTHAPPPSRSPYSPTCMQQHMITNPEISVHVTSPFLLNSCRVRSAAPDSVL